MSRWINADAVRRYIYRPYSNEESYSNLEIDEMLKSAPSIDIVRCKECKHWFSDGGAIMFCEQTDFPTDADDFCSWGERREP